MIDKRKKYIIALDLDGTTLMDWQGEFDEEGRHIHNVHPLTIEAISKMQDDGHLFVICTGRNWLESKNIYNTLNLNSYIINSAGSHIHNPSDPNALEYRWGMSNSILKEILNDEYVMSNINAWGVDVDDSFYIHKDSKGTLRDRAHTYHNLVEFEGEFDFDPQSGILFYNLPDEEIENRVEYLREKWGDEIHFTNWGTTGGVHGGVEINPAKYNKGSSLLKLAEMLNFDKDQTMAFGDGENDFELMKLVEHPVGMKNSTEYILGVIKYRTELDNNNGGVGDFLFKIFNL